MTISSAPRRYSEAQHPYSSFRSVGDVFYIAGQLGVRDNEIVAGGIVAETRQAFVNLAAVLDSAGLTLQDIVKITVYLSTMNDRLAMDDVYLGELQDPLPARTCIEAGALPFSARIELDVIASKGVNR